ncbi:hypothetical protein PV325_001884 [Microctonus aethiopoides]|uniref:Uncharacterized protein n=1 Tax=Microctonus aethiopoides TaxID=144406 RepID=A0AA39FI53_9HYME|nr:hypothetical protein PV325_001884 [Microctonus aethiopoides]KAK0081884.1 hypothetical protein PV326_007448 [Microctonus aethiopoides]KAK0169895.1 hypothetical protein PV328_010529 [Microctonus aethiopoides]
MADIETKETKVVAASPEKKVIEEEKKEVEEVEEVDEDSRASENGDAKETKENGLAEEKEVDEKEVESTENGDSTDAPAADACCIKRKSTAGIEPTVDGVDGASPEKKAKLEEKPVVEAESNGDTPTETAA